MPYKLYRSCVSILCACMLAVICAPAVFAQAPLLSALAKMPVKELTIFKDGHAFVLHEGKMPVDGAGNVQMDYLPTPVIGTFWPYSVDRNVKLVSVVASPRRVRIERTALSLQELLEANPGADVSVTEYGNKVYPARIVATPERSSEEVDAAEPTGTAVDKLPTKGTVLLLKTPTGTAAIPRDRILDVTFTGPYKRTLTTEEFRNLLTLKLDWNGNNVGKTADVGMMYLQKGIRWIPSYKVSLDGKGSATLALQATLINEMTDLNDVTANLVIGVPSFFFQDTPDPIGLQQTFAQLSPYFQNNSQTGYAMSNAMMSQVGGFPGAGARAGERVQANAGGINGPEVGGSGKNEDTFIFTVKHITLKKGQRMILPITEVTLKYRDVYTVDLAFAPPREIRQSGRSSEQQQELLRLQNQPKSQHVIRLTNHSKFPLTTAPALILSNGKVLAQGLMTYTSIGGETDLALTTAVDVKVKKTDKELQRTPNVIQWQGNAYGRIDLNGLISITNYQPQAVEVEVTRNVLGNVVKAEQGGVVSMVNVFEEDDAASRPENPGWWNWYSWPDWWNHFNGVGRIVWKMKLEPGKTTDLKYSWNYFWR